MMSGGRAENARAL